MEKDDLLLAHHNIIMRNSSCLNQKEWIAAFGSAKPVDVGYYMDCL